MSDPIMIRGKVEVKELKQADVKPTLIIGVGGSGGDILLRIRKRFFEKYGALSEIPIVSYLWIDTDATEKDVGAGLFAEHISFGPGEKIMATMADTTKVTNDLNQYPHIKRWFYPGLNKKGSMTEGAGQIRAYSRLGFYDHYTDIRNAIASAGASVGTHDNIQIAKKHRLDADPNDLQVFIVFSLAGGTGSGMFLDLAFLVKEIFQGRKQSRVGYVLMPGLFNPTEDRVFANGYAALKELGHYSYGHNFTVSWPDGDHEITCPPFDYTYLIDRTNYAGCSVNFATREHIFNMVAENIFKDFTQSDFAGYKRGVRDNLQQYLTELFTFQHRGANEQIIIDQKFVTRFSSFGMTSITVPADRIEQACAYKLAADVVDHWGSLSNAGFNAAVLTETVLREVLPVIRLYEGNFSSQGVIEQRRDIQNGLLDDGHRQGQKIQNLVTQSISETSRELRDGIHIQKGQGLAQYMRMAVEREAAKLDNRKGDPQQWGDYARTVYYNKLEMIEKAKGDLRTQIARIINEQHQSVGYAIALLRQVTNVFQDSQREYIPNFVRLREQDLKRKEEGRRQLDQLLAEIAKHEMRSNWDGRKSTILRYDIQRFEEMAPAYLNSVLLDQIRTSAREVCESVIDYIGAEERTESGELISEGLIGELYTLGSQLDDLKRALNKGYEHFCQPQPGELSLMLYEKGDIETHYLPRYIGVGEKARKQIEDLGDQILRELGTSVIDLPKLVRQRGIDKVELQIRDLARVPFSNIRQEFDVVETLWKKYPLDSERKNQIRDIYKNAQFWLHGGSRPRSYKLLPERHKIIVGIPQVTDKMFNLDELKRTLKSIQQAGDPELSIQNLSDSSEIVFYSEAGGAPINWADSVPDLRQKYLQKQADGEELHTDYHEIRFEDVVVLDDRERNDLEQAHECFLLGLIFGEIKPQRAASGQVRYVWSEAVGLRERTTALGEEPRALAELISRKATRATLMERTKGHLTKIRSNRDLMARFYALLDWYYGEIYKPGEVEGPDGVTYPEESNASRAVSKQLDAIDALVRAEESTKEGSALGFRQLSRSYSSRLDDFAPALVDGKRALKPEAAAADATVVNPGESHS